MSQIIESFQRALHEYIRNFGASAEDDSYSLVPEYAFDNSLELKAIARRVTGA